MKKFLEEFKTFISRGNVMDMAVGVIIGGAFGKIVTSLVNDIIMPAIGSITSQGVDIKDMKYVITPEVLDAAGEVATPEVAINYGIFINTIIEFLIIAICIFIVITLIQKAAKKIEDLKKKEEEVKEEAPAEPSEEVKLLTEIRDALAKKN